MKLGHRPTGKINYGMVPFVGGKFSHALYACAAEATPIFKGLEEENMRILVDVMPIEALPAGD